MELETEPDPLIDAWALDKLLEYCKNNPHDCRKSRLARIMINLYEGEDDSNEKTNTLRANSIHFSRLRRSEEATLSRTKRSLSQRLFLALFQQVVNSDSDPPKPKHKITSAEI